MNHFNQESLWSTVPACTGPQQACSESDLDLDCPSAYLTAAVLHVSTGRRCSRSCCPAGAASRCTIRSCCTRAAASSSTPTGRPRPSPKPPETIPSCSWAASPSPPWAWSLKTVRSFLLSFFCLMNRVRRVSVWTPGWVNDLNPFVSTASPPKVQPRYDLDLDASYAKVLTQHHDDDAQVMEDWNMLFDYSMIVVALQTFAGDVGHLWKTSESLLVYQELVRKGVRGLMWVDFSLIWPQWLRCADQFAASRSAEEPSSRWCSSLPVCCQPGS